MNDEEKINKLAQNLYSKGFAGSLWDAKNKAKDILGINNQLKSYRSYEERHVSEIMKDAGVNVEAVKKAEDQKIQQLIQTVQEQFKKQDAVPETAQEMKAPEMQIIPEQAKEQEVAESADKPKDIPSVYFADSVEGATPEMTVNELMGIKEEENAPEELPVLSADAAADIKEEMPEEENKESEALETYEEGSGQESCEKEESLGEAKIDGTEPADMAEGGYVAIDTAEENPDEEIPKIVEEEFKEEEKGEDKIIIEDNVFSDVDKDKVEEEKDNENTTK